MLFIGVLLIILNESASIEIECKYEFRDFRAVGLTYECLVPSNLNITHPDNPTITSVSGIHQLGKSNSDVEVFVCSSCNVEYFPKGLENIFPNLKVISFVNNDIKELQKSDLKPFPNLISVDLAANRIEVIEEDLFKFNRKLKLIHLSYNPISHIDPSVFDDLSELRYLWLESLSCMDERADDNSTAIKEVIKEATSNCTDMEYLAWNDRLKTFEFTHQSLDVADYNQQLGRLEENFKTSKYSNSSTFKKRIKKLHEIKEAKEVDEYIQLKQTVKALEKASAEYQTQISDIQSEIKMMATQNQAQIADVFNKLNEIMKILSNHTK